jgi:mitochondrial chaperone BCS1
MDEQVKKNLLANVENFLNIKTQTWYIDRGFPYRLGLLFYGPLGTGKSSFSLLIVRYFELDIYVPSLSVLDDMSLNKLFAKLPAYCIVLLEDIDAVGIK